MSEKMHKTSIGGQAVMEGVMMKGPKVSAISVDGVIGYPAKNLQPAAIAPLAHASFP